MTKIKQYFEDKRGKKSAVKRYTRSTAGNIALVVFLLAGGLFSMLPLIYCVSTSFKPLDELLIFPPRFFVHRPTIGNYTILPDLMASLKVPLSRYIFNSVAITLFTTFVYILVALMAAYAISKGSFKGRNAIFWTVQFALMFNAYTLAVPQYLIFSKLGLIDTYWIYILPPMASTMGVFLGKQYIEGYVPDALLEAAKIDGAGQVRTFVSIALPLAKPAFLLNILNTCVAVYNDFFIPLMLMPDENNWTVMVRLFITQRSSNIELNGIYAMLLMVTLPIIILYLFVQKHLVDGIATSGMKL